MKNLRNHPDVKSGKKEESQIWEEYAELLDFHHEVVVKNLFKLTSIVTIY